MSPTELRDPEEAAQFLLAGLACQCAVPLTTENVARPLEWALEILAEGGRIPPPGVLGDIGHLALSPHGNAFLSHLPGALPLPPELVRRYEDDVLGRLLTDRSFDRAAAALCQYQGREQARGMAFLWQRLEERARLPGVVVNPAVVKGLLARPPEELLRAASDIAGHPAAFHLPATMYEAICRAFRELGDVLAPEDLFELERGTAVTAFGQRLALRQILQAATALEAGLPTNSPPMRRGHEAPAAAPSEDAYPVGGFSSIATRGSIESLLHSQLAYMERGIERGELPDLFDVKYARDELLYYARDENEFLRPRRAFVFLFSPNLTALRVKRAELPWQQIILACGLVVALVRRLTAWLSDESLTFSFAFVTEGRSDRLEPERDLLALIFQDEIARGTVRIEARNGEVAGGIDLFAEVQQADPATVAGWQALASALLERVL